MNISGVCIGGSHNGKRVEVDSEGRHTFSLAPLRPSKVTYETKRDCYRIESFESDWNDFYLFVEESLTNQEATEMLLAGYMELNKG